MNKAEIYLRAAELCNEAVGSDLARYSCVAICRIEGYSEESILAKDKYQALFYNVGGGIHIVGPWGDKWASPKASAKNCRVLALLFASAMAQTGDI